MVGQVGERWDRPSPCGEWDARGVLEHVIGFHDVLILVPLGVKPDRPRDDPMARWAVTAEAISAVTEEDVTFPEGAEAAGYTRLFPLLTTDVLVHTWDLAAAVGLEVVLDPDLCAVALEGVQRNAEKIAASGMFDPPVAVPPGSDVQSALVALLGRDPRWGRP